MTTKRLTAKDRTVNQRVSAAYHRVAADGQIRVLDLFRILQVGRDAIEAEPDIGDNELDAALKRFIRTVSTGKTKRLRRA
jgi:hypothetical protein